MSTFRSVVVVLIVVVCRVVRCDVSILPQDFSLPPFAFGSGSGLPRMCFREEVVLFLLCGIVPYLSVFEKGFGQIAT